MFSQHFGACTCFTQVASALQSEDSLWISAREQGGVEPVLSNVSGFSASVLGLQFDRVGGRKHKGACYPLIFSACPFFLFVGK